MAASSKSLDTIRSSSAESTAPSPDGIQILAQILGKTYTFSETYAAFIRKEYSTIVEAAFLGAGSTATVLRIKMKAHTKVFRVFNLKKPSPFKEGEWVPLKHRHPNLLETEAILALIDGKLTLFKEVPDHFPSPITTIHPYYPEATDLLQYLDSNKPTLSQVKSFAQQIFAGLSYLHSQSLMHRDLKAENILLISERHIKIIDFGYAGPIENGQLEGDEYQDCGSPLYAAPEILLQQPYDEKVDIYAFSVVLWVLATSCFSKHSHELRSFEGRPKEAAAYTAYELKREQTYPDHCQDEVRAYGASFPNITEAFLKLYLPCAALDPAARATTAATRALLTTFTS